MDEFGFGNEGGGGGGEPDEVQDFLAREQQQFAALNGEATFDDGGATSGFTNNNNLNGEFDDFGDGAVSGGGPSSFGFGSNPSMSSNPDPYAAVSVADEKRAEPESIRKWREEQAVRLAEMDASEQSNIQEWKDQAKHELEEWYKQYQEQIGKNRNNNRVAEEEMMKCRETHNSDDGASWARISDMCDFNHKNHKASKDVSRMRTLLINLKKHPPANAPTAA